MHSVAGHGMADDNNSRHSRPLYVLAMLATAAAAGRGEFLCIPDRQILKLQMTKTSQNLLKAHGNVAPGGAGPWCHARHAL